MSAQDQFIARKGEIDGDWLSSRCVDNSDRQRRLRFLIVDGKAYDDGLYGLPDDAGRLSINGDDEIQGWGAATAFLPDAGELDRIGRDIFAPET